MLIIRHPQAVLELRGGFPPTTYRRPRHYNSSARITTPLPLNGDSALKNYYL